MNMTQEYTGTLEVVTCASCGMTFGINDAFEKKRRADHATFHCPAGHENYYPQKSDVEKQRQRAIAAEARAARYEDALGMERRSKIALKGHLTRARNKIAAGNCPVPDCGQHFSNVREHMKHKHPDWHLTDPETGKAAQL